VAGAQAVAVPRPYDGIQAGLDAYRLGEEKRQAGVSQQLLLNDQMRFWGGFPTSRGNSLYYGYGNPGLGYGYTSPVPPANLESAYAYGGQYPWGGARGWMPPYVFQPWPYVAGDIYGYPYVYQPARQPVGRVEAQTGPNRWESHPVYDPPLAPAQPSPPVQSPWLDNTPYATPRAAMPSSNTPRTPQSEAIETPSTVPTESKSADELPPPGPLPRFVPSETTPRHGAGPREY
jgi:hypothetical protein